MADSKKLLLQAVAAVELLLCAAAPTALTGRLGSPEPPLKMETPGQSAAEYSYILATQLFDPALSSWVAVEDIEYTDHVAAPGTYTPVTQHSGQHRTLLLKKGCLKRRCVPDIRTLMSLHGSHMPVHASISQLSSLGFLASASPRTPRARDLNHTVSV